MPQMQSLPPPPPGGLRVAAAVVNDAGLNSLISPRFARAPFIAVLDIVGGRVSNVAVIPNSLAQAPRGVGIAIAQWLISQGVRLVIAARLGPNITMALQQAGIRVEYAPPGVRLGDALYKLGITGAPF